MVRSLALVALVLMGCPAEPRPAAPSPPPTVKPTTTAPPPDTVAEIYEVHVIDVGTGLSVWVDGPGVSLLYDAGSNDDGATGPKNRVVAFLKHLRPNLATIDHVVLSHPHTDHVVLMPDVIAAYGIGTVWDSGVVNDVCGYRLLIEQIVKKQIGYRTASQGNGTFPASFGIKKCDQQLPAQTFQVLHKDRIDVGTEVQLSPKAKMKFLHADGVDRKGDYNRNTLVALLDLDGARVLLEGDAEAGGRELPSKAPTATSAEGKMLACCASDLKADLLIVGHHGSETSSRELFLDAVKPQVSVISSGPTKYSGKKLPDPEVVTALTTRSALFRTDDGDDACKQNPAKIGPDADGQAGGCSNIKVVMQRGTKPKVSVWTAAD